MSPIPADRVNKTTARGILKPFVPQKEILKIDLIPCIVIKVRRGGEAKETNLIPFERFDAILKDPLNIDPIKGVAKQPQHIVFSPEVKMVIWTDRDDKYKDCLQYIHNDKVLNIRIRMDNTELKKYGLLKSFFDFPLQKDLRRM